MNKSILITLFCLAVGLKSYAQKKEYLTDPEVIEQKAVETLDNLLQEGNSLHKYCVKNEIQGSYVYDIVIWNKGQVATVKSVSREGEIKYQNLLKDYLKELRFPMKLPKNQQYKFRYTFNLK